MKAAIGVLVLCIAYASAVGEGSSFPALEKLVDDERVIVTGINKDLIESYQLIAEDAEVKLTQSKDAAVHKVIRLVEKGHEQILKIYVEAINNDRDAVACYDTAVTKFDTLIASSRELSQNCFNETMNSLLAPLQDLLKVAQSSDAVVAALDTIIPECNDLDFIKMQKCVLERLDQLRPAMEELERSAKTVKQIAEEAFETAMERTALCESAIVNAADSLIFGIEGIKEKAVLCIRLSEPKKL